MKSYIYPLIILIILANYSCNKTDIDITGSPASLNVINAVAGSNSDIIVNTTGKVLTYVDASRINYFNYDGKYANGLLTFGLPQNKNVPIVVTLAKDSTKPVLSESLTCKSGEIFSLFVCGKPESVNYLLIRDTLNKITDSLTSIRVINLSQDISAISVNIAGHSIGSEISRLNYKNITAFKSYPARAANNFYLFEFRDFNTGNLLATFLYNEIARFKHITLVLRGLQDSYPGLEVVRINNW